MLIGLARANDLDLVDHDSVLNRDVCALHDRHLIRKLAELIRRMYKTRIDEVALLALGEMDNAEKPVSGLNYNDVREARALLSMLENAE